MRPLATYVSLPAIGALTLGCNNPKVVAERLALDPRQPTVLPLDGAVITGKHRDGELCFALPQPYTTYSGDWVGRVEPLRRAGSRDTLSVNAVLVDVSGTTSRFTPMELRVGPPDTATRRVCLRTINGYLDGRQPAAVRLTTSDTVTLTRVQWWTGTRWGPL